MSTILSPGEIQSTLGKLPGWSFDGSALAKIYEFKSFREAVSFMVRVAFEAEALNHHPDWSNSYNRVVVKLSTHDAGDKVTAKDVELAWRFEKVAWV
jgi:4a-hydroxytetrahydrobiopterin dehydratase